MHVANVRTGLEDDIEALEFAWRWTNNVHGSWSRRDLAENWDENPAVTVIEPLRTVPGGQVIGHRSSMVGDISCSTASGTRSPRSGSIPTKTDCNQLQIWVLGMRPGPFCTSRLFDKEGT